MAITRKNHIKLVILISSNDCSLAVVSIFKPSMVILLIICFGVFHCFSIVFGADRQQPWCFIYIIHLHISYKAKAVQ